MPAVVGARVVGQVTVRKTMAPRVFTNPPVSPIQVVEIVDFLEAITTRNVLVANETELRQLGEANIQTTER